MSSINPFTSAIPSIESRLRADPSYFPSIDGEEESPSCSSSLRSRAEALDLSETSSTPKNPPPVTAPEANFEEDRQTWKMKEDGEIERTVIFTKKVKNNGLYWASWAAWIFFPVTLILPAFGAIFSSRFANNWYSNFMGHGTWERQTEVLDPDPTERVAGEIVSSKDPTKKKLEGYNPSPASVEAGQKERAKYFSDVRRLEKEGQGPGVIFLDDIDRDKAIFDYNTCSALVEFNIPGLKNRYAHVQCFTNYNHIRGTGIGATTEGEVTEETRAELLSAVREWARRKRGDLLADPIIQQEIRDVESSKKSDVDIAALNDATTGLTFHSPTPPAARSVPISSPVTVPDQPHRVEQDGVVPPRVQQDEAPRPPVLDASQNASDMQRPAAPQTASQPLIAPSWNFDSPLPPSLSPSVNARVQQNDDQPKPDASTNQTSALVDQPKPALNDQQSFQNGHAFALTDKFEISIHKKSDLGIEDLPNDFISEISIHKKSGLGIEDLPDGFISTSTLAKKETQKKEIADKLRVQASNAQTQRTPYFSSTTPSLKSHPKKKKREDSTAITLFPLFPQPQPFASTSSTQPPTYSPPSYPMGNFDDRFGSPSGPFQANTSTTDTTWYQPPSSSYGNSSQNGHVSALSDGLKPMGGGIFVDPRLFRGTFCDYFFIRHILHNLYSPQNQNKPIILSSTPQKSGVEIEVLPDDDTSTPIQTKKEAQKKEAVKAHTVFHYVAAPPFEILKAYKAATQGRSHFTSNPPPSMAAFSRNRPQTFNPTARPLSNSSQQPMQFHTLKAPLKGKMNKVAQQAMRTFAKAMKSFIKI